MVVERKSPAAYAAETVKTALGRENCEGLEC